MDVEIGKRYQVIATLHKTDITRYVMPDILECVALNDDILNTDLPVFRYYARGDNIIKLIILRGYLKMR